ncbi:S8 family serine peptidase [Paenibacillus senegalimassiliensis]|uniref:S8 family serine peptidase n=1 Tax=Paenibacillus senegalimassiliensis TaxID=1737426 RepID=UPI0012FE669C|nr:S8 family serine peptidase [Paenibacillus senegalimassiliensis]
MKNRVAFIALVLTVLLSNLSFAYGDAEQLQMDPLMINKKTIKESSNVKTNIIQLQPIQPRGLGPNDQPLKLEVESKIMFDVQEEAKLKKDGMNGLIPVQVSLDFDIEDAEAKFEKEIDATFGDLLEFERVGYRTYNAWVTREQLDDLESISTIKFIFRQPEKEDEMYISQLPQFRDVTPSMNAASEMLGIKKARNDFQVSGDLDGRETNFTKNDVVIAVVDTGIDASHVDLDGGKVIGWFDAINGKTSPYDDEGHGTHVASIAAGTGEGDPGVQTGVSPGAALVGVKVLNQDGEGTANQIYLGLDWIYTHLDTYKINVVNISIGTQASYSSISNIVNMINKIKNAGVPVFVAAGNEGDGYYNGQFLGRYYDTLSTFAKYTSTSVGSIKDPYEGGWGLSEFSSRGTGSQGPYIVTAGEDIRAAKANSTREYETLSGTSMASPMAAGIYSLMYDAAYSRGVSSSINFSAFDMGMDGYDKIYGNGSLLAYESIKNAAQGSGSFDNYRTYIRVPDGRVQKDYIDIYEIYQSSTTADLNVTLLIIDENMENLDLVIWEPGADPYQGDPSTYYINKNKGLPQENINIKSPKQGVYYIGVYGIDHGARYTLEITGHQIRPN